jgi:hypothetical protein
MIEKDAAQATAFGNKVQNIQGLDVKPMYYPFEAAEEQSMLDVKPMYNPFEAAEEQSMLDVKPMYNPFEALAAVTASKRYSP